HALVEPVAAGDGADQVVLFQDRKIGGIDQLDGEAAETLGDLAHLVHVPVFLVAPVDERLLDAFLGGGGGLVRLCPPPPLRHGGRFDSRFQKTTTTNFFTHGCASR